MKIHKVKRQDDNIAACYSFLIFSLNNLLVFWLPVKFFKCLAK